MSYQHRLTSKSQVTIPKDVRDALGILPGELVRFEVANGKVTLTGGDDNAGARRAKFQAALEKWGGMFHDGRSTDEKMRELRGDYQP